MVCEVSFLQRPNSHLKGHSGLCGCKRKSPDNKTTTPEFIRRAIEVHGVGKYGYEESVYVGSDKKITIRCRCCGKSFSMSAKMHLRGQGCAKCAKKRAGKKRRLKTEDFVERSNDLHAGKYLYDSAIYSGTDIKVNIICRDHGSFMQTPHAHMRGAGCPTCSFSHGEREILSFLKQNGIAFEQQKTFSTCRNINVLPYDFYVPEHNVLIEYHGVQHFKSVEYFGGIEGFEQQKMRDKIKESFANNSGIRLVVIPHWEKRSVDQILSKELGLDKNTLQD